MRTVYGKEIEQQVKEIVSSLKEELGYPPEKMIISFYRGYITAKISPGRISLDDWQVIEDWLVAVLNGKEDEEK